jgi:hypothetical protein
MCQTYVGEIEDETEKANFVASEAEETAHISYQSQFLTMLRYVTSSQAAEK